MWRARSLAAFRTIWHFAGTRVDVALCRSNLLRGIAGQISLWKRLRRMP